MRNKRKKDSRGLALIKKSNNLIEARYKFDIWETRLFLSVLSQIHMNDEDFKVYRINYRDVIKMFKVKSKRSYDLLREGAKSLMKKPLYANYEINGQFREKQYHIIRSIDYLDASKEHISTHKEEGEYIDVTIDPDMKPLLLQLREQGGFTFYELNNVVMLGVYALRIYELLKQYQKFGMRRILVDEMKEMFEITSEYPLFANFYQRVVQPAVDDINRYTDIFIREVEREKDGKKVVSLIFRYHNQARPQHEEIKPSVSLSLFDSKKQQTNVTDVAEAIESELINSVIEEGQESIQDTLFLKYQTTVVGEFGVSPSVFFSTLSDTDAQSIEKAIRVTQRAKIEGRVKNLSGFFIDALRKKFTDAQEVIAEKKAKAQEEYEKKQTHKLLLQQDLANLEQLIIQEENATIRQLVSTDISLTDRAIALSKQTIQENKVYQLQLKQRKLDIESISIDGWRQDEFLRVIVIASIKALSPADFEHLHPFRLKREKLIAQIKAIEV